MSTVISLAAQGVPLREIGRQTGITHVSAHRIAKRHKAQVQAAALAIVARSTQLCVDNHVRKLRMANDILKAGQDAAKEYKDVLAIADKAEQRALMIMGIMPTHTQSTVINNIFNQSTVINNPQVLAVMQDYRSRQMDAVDIPALELDGYDPTVQEADSDG